MMKSNEVIYLLALGILANTIVAIGNTLDGNAGIAVSCGTLAVAGLLLFIWEVAKVSVKACIAAKTNSK